MKTSALALSLLLLFSASLVMAAEKASSDTIVLPAPKTDGKVSVEKALKTRRSLRNPLKTPLTLSEVGQLCWAAQGVTDDKGHRTAPSAMATYPLELYVIAGAVKGLPPGLYHYVPADHSLKLLVAGDKKSEFIEKAASQGWIADAPAVFIITGNPARMGRMKERAVQFTAVEAGLASQGFFLQATAMGFGSTYVGGFDPSKARAALGLPEAEEVLAVLPVGRKP
jgi:SagB-type dehydrogenase family enzyme